jgi:hypothetical protein
MAKQIPPKLFIRCVCEGKATEPNYIWGYLKSKGFKQPNPAYRAKDNSPLGIAKEAKKLYAQALKDRIDKNNIFIWAVFDRDEHQGVSQAIELLRDTPIQVAFSNICFEFWILLHYEYTTRSFSNCDEIIKHIRQQHDADYGKSNDHFVQLGDRLSTALENAEKLMKYWKDEDAPIWYRNPFTNVHELIKTFEALFKKS